jgi:hypothetical protein
MTISYCDLVRVYTLFYKTSISLSRESNVTTQTLPLFDHSEKIQFLLLKKSIIPKSYLYLDGPSVESV